MAGWDLGHPPIEHRWLGMDRRLIWPSLLIVFAVLFYGGIIPAIDEAIEADQFEPGQTVTVGDVVEFNAVPGWAPDGAPVPSSPQLTIFKGGVAMTIKTGGWDSTPDELLDELLDKADYYTRSDRRPFTLPSGVPGVATEIYGIDTDGALFAIVDETTVFPIPPGTSRAASVEIVVEGPAEELDAIAQDVGEMIGSMRFIGPERDTSEGDGS